MELATPPDPVTMGGSLMFSFRIPSSAGDFQLRHAHMTAGDGAVIPADIACEDGLVRCVTAERGAASLAVEWDCGPQGRLLLKTCLLPPRDEPYVLTLELARRHIMLYLVKIEDWGEFSRPLDDPAVIEAIEARRLFMDALAQRADTPEEIEERDALAQRALELAIAVSERVASEHAERELARRQQQAPIASAGAVFGCSVDPERFSEPLQKVVSGAFDYVLAPLRWKELEPEEGKYDFTATDRWIEWAVRQAKMPVAAGPVVEFSSDATPEWFFVWENDYDTIREMVYEHVKRVVTRYRRAVYKWTVASGLNLGATMPLSLEESIDLTRLAALVARKLDPKAMIVVEIDRPLGEPVNGRPQGIPPELYAELVAQSGIACDAFGLRIEVGDDLSGRPTRDLMQISDALDRFAVFEKPLCVSAFGAPSGGNGPGWRGHWSETTQAEWMCKITEIALSKPFVTSVAWNQLYDTKRTTQAATGGLITEAGQPKQALTCAAETRKSLRTGGGVARCAAV